MPVPIQRELEDIIRSEHVSISDLVRDSLREFLAVRKFRGLSKRVRVYARKSGLVTDDDILGLKS